MSEYKLTQREQETIILYNQGEKDVEIYTHDSKLIRILKEHPEVAILKKTNDFGGFTYIVPKKELIIKLRFHFTGERREKNLKRLQEINERRWGGKKKKQDESKGSTPL